MKQSVQDSQRALLADIAEMVPAMQANAGPLDRDQTFPSADLQALREVGALSASSPACFGGFGLGTEPAGAVTLFEMLRLIGRGNLAVGRIIEGHINALALVSAYGTPAQVERACDDAASGHLFAIWNTETGTGLRVVSDRDQLILKGEKQYCSAAGHATRAVVTATAEDGGNYMILAVLNRRERVEPMDVTMQGMRAALIGQVAFDDIEAVSDDLIGAPGDYLREPIFSAGAWRTSAVTLGGLETLITSARRQLASRGRQNDAHQQSRIGRAMIAQETARLWVHQAAMIAEGVDSRSTEETIAYVNLARIAVESATLDAIQLVQRSIGLAGFLQPNTIERLTRDLATYLRQPAPDAVLTEAASWFMTRDGMAIGDAS